MKVLNKTVNSLSIEDIDEFYQKYYRILDVYSPCCRITAWAGKNLYFGVYHMKLSLSDSVEYFFNNLKKINVPNYIPDNQDILYCRKATKGITEILIPVNNIAFLFVDVGGQRSQRQKWFQCFNSVTSILFLTSSSEFDQVLLEDRRTNRLEESKNIFETIVNNVMFEKVSIILFLNKIDLLTKKIGTYKIRFSSYFENFSGNDNSVEEVQRYILRMFARTKRDPEKPLYHHFTTAVSTDNISRVFTSVKDTILHRNLKLLMLQ